MDKQLALQKQKQLRISVDRIVWEEYEMVLLNRIFEGDFGKDLVFRGGTALRLAYHSYRYSDDLDFTQLNDIPLEQFQAWCQETAKAIPYVALDEALQKFYTLYARFKITDPTLERPLGIKVEISRRKQTWTQGDDYILKQLSSEVTPITVLAQVATLAQIEREKESIDPLRIRDIFDLWFIRSQRGEAVEMNFAQYSVREVRGDLHRLLPEGKWQLLTRWLEP
jgi:predicted nucleotidyltransferase component of viral defense system